jgi:type IV secretion system protein VirB10
MVLPPAAIQQVAARSLQPPPPPLRAPDPVPLMMPRADPIARATSSIIQPSAPKPNMLSYADAPARPGADKTGDPATQSGITYAASHVNGVKAGLMGDQTFLLKPGILPCTLLTAINSTFEGPIECGIQKDVRPRGVTLLGRGSIVHGYYKNNVQAGQSRLAVAADWVEDPATGCFMSFDNAPVSDMTGVTGVPGNVNQHTLERFGAAVALTGFGVASNILQAAVSKGGNTYLSFNSGGGSGVEEIANAILRKQIDIPPTITVNQGETIAVFVNKILDFSGCYKLQLKGH